MARVAPDNIIVSIDVGTTKICVVVAQYLADGAVDVIGIGTAPSNGLAKGVVVDVAKTVSSISSAIKEAELMAGIEIESACVGISGGHITALNSSGMMPIQRKNITDADVKKVIASAQAVPIAQGQKILHVLPKYFTIDGGEPIQDPRGMHGVRLEVQAHIILGSVSSVCDLVKCCESAGVKVSDVILEQLASADAVLSDDEKELGVAVLDIGGGTADLALFHKGSIRHTMVLPVAGNHFTNDIAIGLRTTRQCAENIKQSFGSVILNEQELSFDVEQVQGKEVRIASTRELCPILHARAQELLEIVRVEIVKHKLQPFMTAGLVITGGGSLLRGIANVAEKVFSIPVRIGYPQFINNVPKLLDNPMYATGYGLVMHVAHKKKKALQNIKGSFYEQIFVRMKSWVSDFF